MRVLRFLGIAAACLAACGFAELAHTRGGSRGGSGPVHVSGYVTRNGTYVAPHYRSAPDGVFSNNWSTLGNVNPYTGAPGTKTAPSGYNSGYGAVQPSGTVPTSTGQPDAVYAAPADHTRQGGVTTSLPDRQATSTRAVVSRPMSYHEQQQLLNEGRARYWNARGYNFDPASMTAYSMDQKVRDIERASYWRQRGFDFDPSFMSAYSMDQKVRDIERSAYWKQQRGFQFDASYMSAYSMDQKVRDIDRAAYWRQRGYEFNADYMSAYSMDQKVRDIERAAYWKERGLSFNPDFMSAYSMDQAARNLAAPVR